MFGGSYFGQMIFAGVSAFVAAVPPAAPPATPTMFGRPPGGFYPMSNADEVEFDHDDEFLELMMAIQRIL